jgi:hypothetical protein
LTLAAYSEIAGYASEWRRHGSSWHITSAYSGGLCDFVRNLLDDMHLSVFAVVINQGKSSG